MKLKEAKIIAENEFCQVRFSTSRNCWDYTYAIPLKRGYWFGNNRSHDYFGMDKEAALDRLNSKAL